MFLSPLSMVSHSHQVDELANNISDLTNWKICQHLWIDSCNLFIQFRVVLYTSSWIGRNSPPTEQLWSGENDQATGQLISKISSCLTWVEHAVLIWLISTRVFCWMFILNLLAPLNRNSEPHLGGTCCSYLVNLHKGVLLNVYSEPSGSSQ